jgi:hypothetical protein
MDSRPPGMNGIIPDSRKLSRLPGGPWTGGDISRLLAIFKLLSEIMQIVPSFRHIVSRTLYSQNFMLLTAKCMRQSCRSQSCVRFGVVKGPRLWAVGVPL